MSKRKLGRGLSQLFNETVEAEGRIISIPLSKIHANPWQPRRTFNEDRLQELAESIKEKGLIQPVTVRYKPLEGDVEYELATGERRFRAAKLAGLSEIPAILVGYDDETMAEMALIENLQREDLNPMEECDAYALLIGKYKFSQDDMARKVGKSRSHVTNMLRLASLPDEVKDMVRDGKISYSMARFLLSLKTPAEQLAMARKIAEEGLTLRQAEALTQPKPKKERAKTDEEVAAHLKALEEKMGLSVGSKVRIKISAKNHHRGTITIPFRTDEEFKRITEYLSQ